jgi:hypothetical protein
MLLPEVFTIFELEMFTTAGAASLTIGAKLPSGTCSATLAACAVEAVIGVLWV